MLTLTTPTGLMPHTAPPDVDRWINAVATHYRISREAMLAKCRKQPVVWPRMVAMYLASKHTGLSQEGVAAAFGRNRSDVSYAIRAVQDAMSVYPHLKAQVESIQ